jgi:hypothetical protein
MIIHFIKFIIFVNKYLYSKIEKTNVETLITKSQLRKVVWRRQQHQMRPVNSKTRVAFTRSSGTQSERTRKQATLVHVRVRPSACRTERDGDSGRLLKAMTAGTAIGGTRIGRRTEWTIIHEQYKTRAPY